MTKLNSAEIGFEDKIWKAADALRGNMDASEYKHVILGLIFLKYISDCFETKYQELVDEGSGFEEDRDEYMAENIFFVPAEARWGAIATVAHQPQIGEAIDNAMRMIEKDNPRLKGILPKNFARPELDKRRLGDVVDLFTNIKMAEHGNEKDILGRTYEYCLAKNHQGNINNISVFGQDSNSMTWKMAQMNLAIRGIEANLGKFSADTFFDDQHPTLKADFIMANPPFNLSDWGAGRLQDDVRWKYGIPPSGNANFAWLQHMMYRFVNLHLMT